MATISSIKGDYGRFLTDKVNEKITSLTKKFIDETITCKHKISCLDRQHILNMSEVKRVFSKYGYQSGTYSDVALVDMEDTLGFSLIKDDYGGWKQKCTYSDWYEDGCLNYRFFFAVMKNMSSNRMFDYYMRIGIHVRGNIRLADEFKFEQPKYYDAFGAEISERDEVVWTYITRGRLHHNIIEKIENGIAYLDDGHSISLLPNEKLDTVCVMTNKMSWMGMKI